jgi:diguanylate cyclase (GGDEF)-like protein
MSNKRIAVLLLLIAINVSLIAGHKAGFFDIGLDLLAPDNHTAIYHVNSENIQSSITKTGKSKHLICDVIHLRDINYCSITILLALQNNFQHLSEGKDLSKYDTVHLHFDYSGVKDDENLRISFRNYHPDYVIENNYESLKYNSLILDPIYESVDKTVPMSSFGVAGWWTEVMSIPVEQSKLDFSNIAFIEIQPHTISNIGTYDIVLRKFEVTGERISEAALYSSSLYFWLALLLSFMLINLSKLKKQATTDMVTGHINYRGLDEWVNKRLNSTGNGSSCCVFYIDLDDFKKINDKYGHKIGDTFLTFICDTLESSIKPFAPDLTFCFARLSGDELAVAVQNLPEEKVDSLAYFLLSACRTPMITDELNLKLSASIGVSISNRSIRHFEALLHLADMAMYKAKQQGKNTFVIYDEELSNQFIHKVELTDAIRAALKLNQFTLLFMPIANLHNDRVARAEVLLRTKKGVLEGIGPDVFIPIAEESALIHHVDMWVIEKTFSVINANRPWVVSQDFVFCINISAVELHTDGFVEKLQQLIEQYDIDPRFIELELTETSLIDVDNNSIQTMQAIKDLGIKLALDDFGTGYTAFSQLEHFPVDCIKIDRSFVNKLSKDETEKHALIDAVMRLSKAFHLSTIAEGVETYSQLLSLHEMHCDMVQGCLISKPLEFDALCHFVSQPHWLKN